MFNLKYEKILTSIIHLIKINKQRNQSKYRKSEWFNLFALKFIWMLILFWFT